MLEFLRRREPSTRAAPAPGTVPDWLAELFVPALSPALARADGHVLVWTIDGANTAATVTDQFKANAAEYHRRYSASDHFARLFQQALEATGVRIAERPTILDLGSGSGANSVVPCQAMFPGARIVSTDLSAELLAMLGEYLLETAQAGGAQCVQMDAMSAHVAPAAYDLVTGASILHHLDSPAEGIAAAGRALRPGGHAIFFEPFHGWTIMQLAFERVIAEADLRGEPLDKGVDAALRRTNLDIRARNRFKQRTTAEQAEMDDKWLFSRAAIRAAGEAAGFSEVRFVPHNDHPSLYRDSAAIQLRLATGRDDLAFPEWALAILDQFDAAMPLQAKREFMLEGTIVMTKSAA